jgi:hypothetical protein
MINWKTTLFGIIAGTLTILQTTLTAYQDGTKVQWLQVALGIAFMAFGVIAKDFNVTGAGATAVTAEDAKKKVEQFGTVVKFGCIFALSCLAGLSQTACGGSLHSTIETIMVFQAEVHTEQAQVLLAANAAIATLPADQQQAALSALNSANDKLTAALNTKDAALQAALDASDASGINIQQIESDIMIAVNAVVSLIQTFGVAEQTQRAQAAATRLLAARTPVVHK